MSKRDEFGNVVEEYTFVEEVKSNVEEVEEITAEEAVAISAKNVAEAETKLNAPVEEEEIVEDNQ